MLEALEARLLLSAADPVPPAAAISTPDVTLAGGATQAVTVTYTDNVAIARTSVGQSDVTVTGPGGTPLAFKSVVAYPLDSGPQVVATYVFTAPGGSWGPEDDGTYTVTVLPNTVFDTGGNAVPQTSQTFAVDVPAGGARDTTPPTETIAPPAPPAFGTSSETIQVTYSDNVGIDPTLIDPKNVQVFRPGGGQLAITGVSESPSPDGRSVVATYTVAAPGGTWGPEDAGAYTVKVLSGHVTDTSGNPNPEASLTFRVSAAPSPASGLLATISPPPRITAAGGTTQTIAVTYRSPAGVDVASIDAGDLFVSRSGGPALAVTGVSVSPAGGGAAVTATYTVAAPGGAWGPTDNGAYVVTIQPNQVRDLAGNTAATFSGSFEVNVPTPRPTVDPTFHAPPPAATTFTAEDTAALPGGKVIVVGRTGDVSAGTGQAVIERLNADGSLDTSFGAGGKITTPAAGDEAYYAVRPESDGSVVVAGTRGGDFAVTRYRANGTLDPKFGRGGEAVADLGADDVAYGLAVAPDGSVVAAGSSGASFAFARFLASGRLDPSFGQRGTRVFPLTAGAGDVIGDVAVAPGGDLFAAGASGAAVVLLRLTASGSPVASFGTGGVQTVAGLSARTDLSVADYTEGVAVQADGRVVVASRTPGGDFGVARLNPDGSPDANFGNLGAAGAAGTTGLATADFGGDDDGDRVFVQGSGEIIAVGTTDAGGAGGTGATQTAVAAFNPDGTLDPAFGNSGLFTAPLGSAPGTGVPARRPPGGAPTATALSPLAVHIGDIFLHAFGSPGPGGLLIIGASGQTGTGVAAVPAASSVRRLFVPGSSLLGAFGAGTAPGGKAARLHFIASNGAAVTVTLTGGGAGRAFYDGTNVDLALTGTGPRSAVSVQTAGGRALTLRNVRSDGPLRAFTAPAVDLDGTLSLPGSLGTLTLGSLTGTVAAGNIASLAVSGNVSGAAVLSGANFGADGLPGGTGAAADTFAAGSISKIRVNGSVAASVFAAGLDPGPNASRGSLLNAGATIAGGAASRIGPIQVKAGTDAATRFVAGAFATARLPKKVIPADDPRFEVL